MKKRARSSPAPEVVALYRMVGQMISKGASDAAVDAAIRKHLIRLAAEAEPLVGHLIPTPVVLRRHVPSLN